MTRTIIVLHGCEKILAKVREQKKKVFALKSQPGNAFADTVFIGCRSQPLKYFKGLYNCLLQEVKVQLKW